MEQVSLTAPRAGLLQQAQRNAELWRSATDFESAFLAEMLKSAGLGAPDASLGGGPGQDQFQSFLVNEQARAMTAAGGIGVAEIVYRSLLERADG